MTNSYSNKIDDKSKPECFGEYKNVHYCKDICKYNCPFSVNGDKICSDVKNLKNI